MIKNLFKKAARIEQLESLLLEAKSIIEDTQEIIKKLQEINADLMTQLKASNEFSAAQVQTNRTLQSRLDQIIQQLQEPGQQPSDQGRKLTNIYHLAIGDQDA